MYHVYIYIGQRVLQARMQACISSPDYSYLQQQDSQDAVRRGEGEHQAAHVWQLNDNDGQVCMSSMLNLLLIATLNPFASVP